MLSVFKQQEDFEDSAGYKISIFSSLLTEDVALTISEGVG